MRRLVSLVLASALALGAVGAGAVTAVERLVRAPFGDGVITLLLLGADDGPPRAGTPLRARADGIHLLFVAPDRRRATLLDVPRDAWVTVAGRGRDKVNACLADGPRDCVATVEGNWDVEVDGYLLTSMNALVEAFDEFAADYGRVRVEVERPLTDGGPDITETGLQPLRGAQVLTYARDRKHRPRGDLDRTAAQSRLLLTAFRQAHERGLDAAAAADLVATVRRTTVTDLSDGDLLRLGLAALQVDPDRVQHRTLPGSVGTVGRASVVFLADRADALVADAAGDGALDEG